MIDSENTASQADEQEGFKVAASDQLPRSGRFRRRMSVMKKRQWKEMAPTKKDAVMAPLAAGRAKQLARYAAQRPAWEIVKDRLDGIGRNALANKYGSAKQVDYVLRSAGIPKSKACKYDRSEPFTRGSGTALQKALGFTKNEFAKHATIRERRVVIWLTNPQNKLEPSEARKCIALRNRIAAKLLADETVTKLSNLDSYNRAQVLVTLFPRLKSEYELLLTTFPTIRTLAQAKGIPPTEKELGVWIYDESVKGTLGFRQLLRWLPALAAWMLAGWDRFRGEDDSRFLAYELLAFTSSCPWKIVKAAISNRTRRLNDRQMRELVRWHLPSGATLPALGPLIGMSNKKGKGGRPKGMTEARLEEGKKLERLIEEYGSSRGAIKRAAAEVYPEIGMDLAYDRARQTRREYSKRRSTNRDKN